MTHTNRTPRQRPVRRRAERGIAIAMTGLLLVPLLIFAAFGVDLASWYARISELQRGADAAALAGAVWMPDIGKASAEAEASLISNGLHPSVDPSIVPVIAPGSTSTSLRVTLTDTNADRHFSQIFVNGPATLTRFAEAEYNLPLPLGSPLNYFGGDSTRTEVPPVDSWSVNWPSDYQSRVPANPSCNVGTSSGQGLGRWSGSPPSYNPTGHSNSSSTVCAWTVTGTVTSGTTTVPPPDYFNRQPTNVQCRVRINGTGATIGAWVTGPTRYVHESAGGLPSGAPSCSWSNMATDAASVPSFATTTAPVNRPCRVGYETSRGWWNTTGGHQTGSVPVGDRSNQGAAGGSGNTGNQLCRWSADAVNTPIITPNPIDPTRSPGFWAAVGGPGDVANFGEAFSAECHGQNTSGGTNCSSVQNLMHRTTGYWYVIEFGNVTATTSINVFDAAYNPDPGTSTTNAGDTRGDFDDADEGFTTSFRLYQWNNQLDFNDRTALGPATGNQAEDSCHWALRDEPQFRVSWQTLCTINPSPNSTYLLNVRTSSDLDPSDGINGYAFEAVAVGAATGPHQPAVYAYESMGMRNNIEGGIATFYLAEVGPQYAGRTLVIELFDSGDATGNAFLRPVMPRTSLSPVTWGDIPSSLCSYTASPAPNQPQTGGSGGATSPSVTTQTTPSLANCQIQTTSSGTGQFNGLWLTIRVQIPSSYTCTLGVNPETTTGSCWWGIRYNFTNATANDVTTWRARVEGNPLQLTQ